MLVMLCDQQQRLALAACSVDDRAAGVIVPAAAANRVARGTDIRCVGDVV